VIDVFTKKQTFVVRIDNLMHVSTQMTERHTDRLYLLIPLDQVKRGTLNLALNPHRIDKHCRQDPISEFGFLYTNVELADGVEFQFKFQILLF